MARIGIVGARVHGRPDLVRAFVRTLPAGTVVVSGGAEDVVTWAEEEARAAGLETVVHRPFERTRDALLARNAVIANDVQELHVWPWLGSSGTHHTAGLARARGIPVVEHPMEPRCEVFTARWGLRGDADVFNIMRGWAERHPPSEAWRRVPQQHLSRSVVTWARERMGPQPGGKPGLSLLAAQTLAARCGVPSLGEAFAPSAALLRPALAERKQIEGLADEARILAAQDRDLTEEEEQRRIGILAEVERRDLEHWGAYTRGFRAEMVRSYREKAIAWGWLLTLPRVTLCCACIRPDRCHRGLLATMLGKLGATVGGEIES